MNIMKLVLLLMVAPMSFGQLTGSFTIGASGDYATINDAFTDMQTQGVAGTLIFSIQDGTYTEQVTVDGSTIAGLSTANITIQGTSTRDAVVWTFNADAVTEKYTLSISNFDNLTLSNMTLQSETTIGDLTVVSSAGTLNNITFDNCIFTASEADASDFGALVDWFNGGDYNDIVVTNCRFFNSFRGLSINGGGQYHIANSGFFNQFKQSLSLGNSEGIKFEENVVIADSLVDGVYFGLEIWNSADYVVAQSRFIVDAGEGALVLNQNYLADSTANIVSNNYFQINDRVENTNAVRAALFEDVEFLHNTIRMLNGGNALFLLSGTNITIHNNNIIHQAGGRIYFTSGSGVSFANSITSDNNNLYTDGDYTVFASSLEDFQTASNQDLNSVSYDTPFRMDSFPDVCHYGLFGVGLPNIGVSEDFYGTAVDETSPDIGAFKFDLPDIDLLSVTDTTLCDNDSLELDAGAGYASYLWSSGGTEQIEYIVEANGPIVLEVSDTVSQCILGDSVFIFLDDVIVELGVDSLICQGTSMELFVSGEFQEILWSTGATDTSITITEAGAYWVRTLDSVNCVDFDTMELSLSSAVIEPNFLVGSEACVEDSVFFFDVTSITADTYEWDFGGSGSSEEQYPFFQFGAAGDYDIVLTVDYQDCIGKEISKTITVIDCPQIDGLNQGSVFGDYGLYPNPNNGSFNLDINLTRETSLRIQMAGMDGTEVLNEEYSSVEVLNAEFDLTGIPVGFYVLYVLSEGEAIQIRILVQ